MSRLAKKMAKKLIAGKAALGMHRKGGGDRRPTRLNEALDAMSISVSLKRQNCLVRHYIDTSPSPPWVWT